MGIINDMISKHDFDPLLNEILVAEIKINKTTKLMERLFNNNLRKIFQLYMVYHQTLTQEDVISLSYLALDKAVNGFNPTFGKLFGNYFEQKIRAEIQIYFNYNHNTIHIPVLSDEKVEIFDIDPFSETVLEDDKPDIYKDLHELVFMYGNLKMMNKQKRKNYDVMCFMLQDKTVKEAMAFFGLCDSRIYWHVSEFYKDLRKFKNEQSQDNTHK